jgi:hypothetical protein
VYAFVGDLNPALGRVGFVISRDWSAAAFQGVTLCDSGGLFMGIGGFEAAGPQALGDLVALSSPNACSSATWAETFEREVAEHYLRGPRGYVDGAEPVDLPAPRGDYIAFERVKGVPDRRLWTWELRMYRGPSPRDYVAVALTDIDSKHLEAIEYDRGPVPSTVAVLPGKITQNGHLFQMPRLRSLLLEEES